MTLVLTLAILVLSAALAAATVTMPVWLGRALVRHQFWAVRDRIRLDLARGRVQDCEAVWALIDEIESLIASGRRMSLLTILIFGRQVSKRLTPKERDELAQRVEPNLEWLEPETQDYLRVKRRAVDALAYRHLLFGSWLGLGVLALASIVAAARSIGQRDFVGRLRDVVRQAAEASNLGDFAPLYVAAHPDDSSRRLAA